MHTKLARAAVAGYSPVDEATLICIEAVERKCSPLTRVAVLVGATLAAWTPIVTVALLVR